MSQKPPAQSPFLRDAVALRNFTAVARAKMADLRAGVEISIAGAPSHMGCFVFAGTSPLFERLEAPWFSEADLAIVHDSPQFGPEVARALPAQRCRLDIDAPPEGTVFFPGEPVVTIEGPLAEAVLVAPLIGEVVGRATYIATLTRRMVEAAQGDQVIEDLRLGEETALSTRAAFVGGAAGTTSLEAAHRTGVPLFAAPSPDLARFTKVDQQGPPTADLWGNTEEDAVLAFLGGAEADLELLARRQLGQSRRWLARGLDGHVDMRWDLVALEQNRAWAHKLGFGRDASLFPGRKLVIRYCDDSGRPLGDLLQSPTERMQAPPLVGLVAHLGADGPVWIQHAATATPLLSPGLRGGRLAAAPPPLIQARLRAEAGWTRVDPAVRRLRSPERYLIGTSAHLTELRSEMLRQPSAR